MFMYIVYSVHFISLKIEFMVHSEFSSSAEPNTTASEQVMETKIHEG